MASEPQIRASRLKAERLADPARPAADLRHRSRIPAFHGPGPAAGSGGSDCAKQSQSPGVRRVKQSQLAQGHRAEQSQFPGEWIDANLLSRIGLQRIAATVRRRKQSQFTVARPRQTKPIPAGRSCETNPIPAARPRQTKPIGAAAAGVQILGRKEVMRDQARNRPWKTKPIPATPEAATATRFSQCAWARVPTGKAAGFRAEDDPRAVGPTRRAKAKGRRSGGVDHRETGGYTANHMADKSRNGTPHKREV